MLTSNVFDDQPKHQQQNKCDFSGSGSESGQENAKKTNQFLSNALLNIDVYIIVNPCVQFVCLFLFHFGYLVILEMISINIYRQFY